MRRAFDVLSAAIGLFLLAPLFALIALAIKIEDRGPVFYSQLRVGKDFRRFRFFKFRSMIPGADRLAPLTAPGDSRRTRIGRLLRKCKLDELPQLINVLTGDIQLVGARPELEPYVEKFRSQYSLLLQDRPGITDPATLAYRREEQLLEADHVEEQYVSKILPRKLELSLEYARRRSFPSDLGIVLRTVFTMFGSLRDSEHFQGTSVPEPRAPIRDSSEL
jgi:lipopolysaccharide/colanic/teichoic acid biosynthesis glycosyltransferase